MGDFSVYVVACAFAFMKSDLHARVLQRGRHLISKPEENALAKPLPSRAMQRRVGGMALKDSLFVARSFSYNDSSRQRTCKPGAREGGGGRVRHPGLAGARSRAGLRVGPP